MVCPIKNQDWNNIVAKYGEDEAYRAFVLNRMETPTFEEAEGLLGGNNIKPGVQELFESNPELANQVYEALGFNNLKNSTENTLLYDNAIEKIRSLINTKIGKYLPTDIPRSKFDENKKGVILNYNKSVFNELFDIVTEIVENYSDFKYSVNNAVRLSQIKKLEEGELYSNFREIDVLIEKLKNLGVNTPTDLFQTIYNKIDKIKQISDSIDRNESLPRFEKIQKIADIRVNLDKFLTDYLENIINPSRIFKDYFIKPLDLNNQITPQQKQQAISLYSQYLQQNPKGNVEGFKQYLGIQNVIIKPGVQELFESNPELANKVYQALGFNNINESEITYTDENGKPCAAMGLKPSKFQKGGKWEIIKEFKGKSHAQGGIDIEIGKGGIKMSNKQGKFEAKYGLVIPKNN